MRKLFRTIHLWVALTSGAVMLAVCASGVALMFEPEIEHAFDRESLHLAPDRPMLSIDDVLERTNVSDPSPAFIRLAHDSSEPHEFWMGPGRRDPRLLVDPSTGKIVQRVDPARTVIGWLALLHIELFAGELGGTVVGLSGIALAVTSVTGVVLWWPRRNNWTKALRVRTARGFHPANYDLHQTTGILTLPLVLLIALTGVALIFWEPVYAAIDLILPGEVQSEGQLPSSVSARSAGEALAVAGAMFPTAEATWLTPPGAAEGASVRMRFPSELHPNGRTFVNFDASGRLTSVIDAREAATGSRVKASLYPLHIGPFRNSITRWLWAAGGVAPCFLFAGGLVMWWKRRWAPRRSRASRVPATVHGRVMNEEQIFDPHSSTAS